MLTEELAELAASLAGTPMIYELATSALQRLPSLVADPPRLSPMPRAPAADGLPTQGDVALPDKATEPKLRGERERRPRERRNINPVAESRVLREERDRCVLLDYREGLFIRVFNPMQLKQ